MAGRELGEEKGGPLYAEINVDVPHYKVDKPFHYIVPAELRGRLQVGMRVLVPFGPRSVEGYVAGFVDAPGGGELRPIEAIIDEVPMLTQELLDLSRWMARRYVCPQAKVLRGILPAGIRFESVEVVRRVAGEGDVSEPDLKGAPRQAEILRLLREKGGEMEIGEIGEVLDMRSPQGPLHGLQEKGLITLKREWRPPRVRPRMRGFAELLMDGDELIEEMKTLETIAPAQARIVRTLLERGGGPLPVSELLKAAGAGYSSLHGLEVRSVVRCREMELERDPLAGETFERETHLQLTREQEEALATVKGAIDAGVHRTILVHGVTGSGKTEIYLQAIDYSLKKGKAAILLVPEISLTPQMVNHFISRFGREVAVLHSHLSPGERYDQWRKIRRGDVRIAIGARSAVFSPFENLGLIIIDEEHENSYKQSEDPKYHARDVAIQRAREGSAVVLLGSATPSVESYYLASKGYFTLVSLKSRVEDRPMPAVDIVDMRNELKAGNRSIFSGRLRQAISERLVKGEQIILFLNRRGHSTFVMCRECGYVMKCKHCDLSLTYHDREKVLRCHYCNYEVKVPDICPNCRGVYIKYLGIGTERVEKEIKFAFPGVSVLRMDSDTTTRKGSHKRILDAFREGKADILVGTQMIAKGLDFPNVTLVGVIIADTTLHFPDFRSSERTFQLLTQVAGRAGRGAVPGEVIIQTYTPEHYSIVAAKTHDYRGFYDLEIKGREELGYPPFSHLINIVVSHEDGKKAARYAEGLRRSLEGHGDVAPADLVILGPAPAPLAKIKDRYRQQMLLKAGDIDRLSDLVSMAVKEFSSTVGRKDDRLILQVDVDPASTM